MKEQITHILIYFTVVMIFFLSGCTDANVKYSAAQNEVSSQAPFYLTLAEVADWSEESSLADADNVSSVPLASRFVDPQSQLDPSLPSRARVLIAPDGIGNHANYVNEQPTFNQYTFTQWAHVDAINWFGGTAELNVSVPSRPWVEAAHRNGVKVLGTVFFAPKAWGGNEQQPADFLRRNAAGDFLYVQKLIEIANYYGFDGWLINQETDLADADPTLGEQYLEFMYELTTQRPTGMEIHWYDSMLPDGSVIWQNELNNANARYLQDSGRRTADAMFINYWWNRARIETSLNTAAEISRSPFDVYTGADLWPGRPAQSISRAPRWLEILDSAEGGPETSIALFASNYPYIFSGFEDLPAESNFARDESDVASYYRAEQRLFAGDDLNLAITDSIGKWPGIGSRIPARSTLQQLPFISNFSTGHGRIKARHGHAFQQAWHDMAAQDILPSWQFAVYGNLSTTISFDFERAYHKGNSLRVDVKPASGLAAIPLYKTAIKTNRPLKVEVVYALSTDYQGASLWLETAHGQIYRLRLAPTGGEWSHTSKTIEAAPGNRIIRIGLDLAAAAESKAVLHIGELQLHYGEHP